MPPKGRKVADALDVNLMLAALSRYELREREAKASTLQQAREGSESARRVAHKMGKLGWWHVGVGTICGGEDFSPAERMARE